MDLRFAPPGNMPARRPPHRVAWFAAPVLFALLFAGCAPQTSSGPPHVALDFEKYTLPNGLEVILRKDSKLPITAVNIWYHVGPANEAAGRTGFAHLFEHMMFQASGHVPDDQYFPILEGAGASFINGTTDFDRTNYLEDVPSNELELALWLESDRMGFLLDRLDATMLANQQDVVRNERRQSIETQPYGMADEELWHQLFPKEHPYHAYVMGSHDDIQAAKLADVHDFFKRFYCPNNATLVIAGDIDVAKTKELVQKYFGTIARGPDVPKVDVKPPVLTAEKRVTLTDRVKLPRVDMGWITPTAFQPGDAAATLAGRILGQGKASRLYKALVYEQKIAQNVTAQQQSYALGSVFEVTVTAKPGHTAEELNTAIDAEIKKLATDGPTAEELQAAQTATYSGIITGLEEVGGFGGVANRLNLYNHYLHDPGYLQKDLERYAAVTTDELKKFCAEQLRTDNRVVVLCNPGDKTVPPGPPTPPPPPKNPNRIVSAEPWRNTRPEGGPPSTAPLPSAKSLDLGNGLKVLLVESHELPVVSAELVVRAGASTDPPDRPGLAGFSVSMMDEGTAKHDALGLARDLESLGAELSTASFSDGSTVTASSLKGQADQVMSLMSEVVTAPSFPESEVERVRNDRLTALLQQKDSPFQTAMRVMTSCLYGDQHPYGHLALGTEDGVKKVSRDELVKFYHGAFSPSNAALVLAGDLTEAEARRLASRAFGDWKGTGEKPGVPGEGNAIPEKVVIVDTPGAPQTALVAAQLGVARSDPDYEKLNVMNQVLGGLFSSRVNMNLREQHGYSYGAFSFMRDNRGVGPLIVGSMVRTDVTGPALKEMMKEVDGMKEKPVTDQELKLAKESIARSLPALFETSESTAGTVANLFLFDQAPDYYQSLPERLAGMTAAEVFDATRRHLSPENMRIIAVGDRAKIDGQIKALKLGPVTYRTTDAKPFAPAP